MGGEVSRGKNRNYFLHIENDRSDSGRKGHYLIAPEESYVNHHAYSTHSDKKKILIKQPNTFEDILSEQYFNTPP
jgi:hypothetical protein